MQKVIVINDFNGHTSVFEFNKENLTTLLTEMIEAERCDDVIVAEQLLENSSSLNELEEFLMNEQYVCERGGQVHILKIEKIMNEGLLQ